MEGDLLVAKDSGFQGLDRLNLKLKAFGVDATNLMKKAVADSALRVESDAKISIQRGSRSGRVYKRGSISHRASAPGEPPKTDTGNLVSNISTRFEKEGLVASVGVMSERAIYGAYLELGTRDIEPRPWLMPALNKNKRNVEDAFVKELRKAIRRNTRG